ncbi:MAG: Rpn family recombination-promoting nuclease/putative transposase [Polyangiaceae bacterium]
MQPHDRLFRAVFSAPEHAKGLLCSALPPAIANRTDWDTLHFLPTSVIDSTLREARTDLLFSATIAGRRALYYVLLEHQSEPDRRMPLRLLGYMLRIWEELAKTSSPLPAIVPIVCHHSTRGWESPIALRELIDLPADAFEDFAAHLPTFEPIFDDLSRAADDELRMRVLSTLGRAALVCLTKVRGATDVLGVLGRFEEAFRAVLEAPSGVAALAQICSYILHTTEVTRSTLEPFFARLGEGAKEALMTGADQLIAEGIARGRAQGLAEGKVEGKAEGKAELLERQLRIKFGEIPAATRERLARATLEQLDRWAERLLACDTLDAVFE